MDCYCCWTWWSIHLWLLVHNLLFSVFKVEYWPNIDCVCGTQLEQNCSLRLQRPSQQLSWPTGQVLVVPPNGKRCVGVPVSGSLGPLALKSFASQPIHRVDAVHITSVHDGSSSAKDRHETSNRHLVRIRSRFTRCMCCMWLECWVCRGVWQFLFLFLATVQLSVWLCCM